MIDRWTFVQAPNTGEAGVGMVMYYGSSRYLQDLRVVISLSLVRAWLEGDIPSFQRPRWREPEWSVTIVWTTFKPSNAHTSASAVWRVRDTRWIEELVNRVVSPRIEPSVASVEPPCIRLGRLAFW